MPQATVETFYEMINTPVFLSAFFSWFSAQLLKSIIESFKARPRTSKDFMLTILWQTGGMPSSHSALVTALATSIGFYYGPDSPLFTLSLFYGILIIRDALGVRRSAGNQAQSLNLIGTELKKRFGIDYKVVKEVNGHNPAEVSVGILLGFFVGIAFSIL